MRLVTFLVDFRGYKAGKSQYYEPKVAESLIEQGIVMDAYEYQRKQTEGTLDEVKVFAPTAPPKDKIVRKPKTKK